MRESGKDTENRGPEQGNKKKVGDTLNLNARLKSAFRRKTKRFWTLSTLARQNRFGLRHLKLKSRMHI